MEVAVHVEADNAKVVRSGHVGDEALSIFSLLRHSHPYIPVPQLQCRLNTLQHTFQPISKTSSGAPGLQYPTNIVNDDD